MKTLNSIPLVFIAFLGSISLSKPAYSEWYSVKAFGEANSAYVSEKKCKSNSNESAVFGALFGGFLGNELSGGDKWAVAFGATAGGWLGGLLSGGACDGKAVIALSDPTYKYPNSWSEIKAKGVKNSSL